MLKVLRLTSCLLKEKISLVQLSTICCDQQQLLFSTSAKHSIMASQSSKSSVVAGSSSTATNKESTAENLGGILKFLEIVGNLKHIKRTGWVLRDVNDCETVAGHMYRMSIMTFLLEGKEGLNQVKCLELALVHDLAESIVGDITPYCGVTKEDKKKREMTAMVEMAKLIAPRGERLLELFIEYEENQTAESKFVKDLDRLDMVLQAFEYEKRDNCPQKHQEFFDSTEGKFSHPLVVDIVRELNAQRLKNSTSLNDDDDDNSKKEQANSSIS